MSAEVSLETDLDVDQITASYRAWREWDSNRPSAATIKKQLNDVEAAARHLAQCMTDMSSTARTMMLCLPSDNLLDVAEAAKRARESLPVRWQYSAARQAASSLLALFNHRGTAFTATADSYGGASRAVLTLLRVANEAGDRSMTAEAARKWVEGALDDHAKIEQGKLSEKTAE